LSQVDFSVTITNNNPATAGCTVQYLIDIRFLSPEDFLVMKENLVYAGNLPFNESFDDVGNSWRLIFTVSVAPGATTTFLFPFQPSAVTTTPVADWTAEIFVNPIRKNALCFDYLDITLTRKLFTALNWGNKPFRVVAGVKNLSELINVSLPAGGWDSNILLQPEVGSSIAPTLTIDQDYVLGSNTSDSEIFLSPGATIRVAAGKTLVIRRNFIHTCTQLAQGIVVEPGGKLVMTNTKASDCRFAVDAKAGATLELSNLDFANNYIGLNLDMNAAPQRVTLNKLENCDFYTEAPGLKQAFAGMPEALETRGYCGIRLKNYLDFNNFGNNHFSQLANGILADNSTGNLGNLTFDDLNSVGTPAYPLEGYGIRLDGKGASAKWFNLNEFWTTMTFNNCKTGIYAARHALNVENTLMTNVHTGIDCANSPGRDIVIAGNNIQARKRGIRSLLNEPLHPISAIRANTLSISNAGSGTEPPTGIELAEGNGTGILGSGWAVSGNALNLAQGGRGILYRGGLSGSLKANTVNNNANVNYQGIRVEGTAFSEINFNDVTQASSASGLASSQAIRSSAGWANAFACNCTDRTGVGLQFYDLADFSNQVQGNQFKNHGDAGLQLGDDVLLNTYIGEQAHRGNKWLLSAIPTGGYGGINWGSPDVVAQSFFYVDGSEQGGSLNPPVDPIEWFTNQPSTGTFACQNDCVAPSNPVPFAGEGGTPSKLDEAIATGTLPTDGWAAETQWKGKYRLYRKMLRQPGIYQYAPAYATFFDAETAQATGQLAELAEERAKLYRFSAAQQATVEDYRAQMAHEMAALKAMDSLRQAGGSVDATTYANALNKRALLDAQYEQYLEGLATTRQQKMQALLAWNNGIATNLAPAHNHKALNALLLDVLIDKRPFDAADRAGLEVLAAQCPLAGGDAVYEARALLGYLTGQEYDDHTLCDTGNRPAQGRSEKMEVGSTLSVFPNPTMGLLYWNSTGETVTARVFDAMGKMLVERKVADGYLDLSALRAGLYHLQVIDEGNPVLLFNGHIAITK
jgi:hypothetical protein